MLTDLGQFWDSPSEDSDMEDGVPERNRRRKVFRGKANFDVMDGFDFKERFRLRRMEVETVLHYIGAAIRYPTSRNNALTPSEQVLICLHWMGNGGQYHGIADMHGVSKGTVCTVIHRVVEAIIKYMFRKFVSWPENMQEVSLEFLRKGGFPSVAGCVDGTLIKIDAPTINEAAYVDRHGNHSINCLMVCGPDYRFYFASARWPGSVHDSRVMRNSNIRAKFDSGWRPFEGAVILGDTGYGLREWLIPPICRNSDSPSELTFNLAHKSTRRIIECAYGILKERFPCLQKLRLEPTRAGNVIIAAATLHNIATTDDFPFQPNPEVEDAQANWVLEDGCPAEGRINELLAYFT